MLPALKNNAAAGHKDPVKIELLNGTDPLKKLRCKWILRQEDWRDKGELFRPSPPVTSRIFPAFISRTNFFASLTTIWNTWNRLVYLL